LRLDESVVPEYTVADDIPYHPDLEVTGYPIAGDPLPRVDLGIVAAAGGNVRWLDHFEYSPAEYLISRVDWSADSKAVVYQLQNREQTWLDLRSADPDSGANKLLFRETTDAWVSVLGPPHWLKDGSFLWLSERDGNQHIYHVTQDGKKVVPVTSGPWDVATFHGVDEQNEWIYFSAAKDNGTSTQGFRTRLDGRQLTCLTPGMGSHVLRFNDTYTHFIHTRSATNLLPATCVRRADGKPLHAIDPNLDDRLKYYKIREPEFVQVPARDGLKLDGMIIKPYDFDTDRKYPVLCYVYSGPQSPTVRNRWGGSTYLWHQMLAQQGYVIWMCDNRSASTKGARYAWKSHRNLGREELKDIEDGLSWLKQHPWIDADRIGIWGWSYGGYMTSYALTHSSSFKVGIAGAPVTDWRNYDAIYTERYMGLPQRNPSGYRESSAVAAADRLSGRLLLIHGAMDDNVHISNTLQLAYALQNAGKQFDIMLYPRNRHGITDPSQSRHLRELMTRFIVENL
jgi:dipeptidyl-peptidase-4